jgi:hypothetical protein
MAGIPAGKLMGGPVLARANRFMFRFMFSTDDLELPSQVSTMVWHGAAANY